MVSTCTTVIPNLPVPISRLSSIFHVTMAALSYQRLLAHVFYSSIPLERIGGLSHEMRPSLSMEIIL